jgi:hypothetical protein
MPLAKRLLVHAYPRDLFRLPTLQASGDRAVHDPMRLVPSEPHPLRDRLLAGRFQPVDHQSLEEHRKPGVGFGPWHAHQPHAMLGTGDPGDLRADDRAVLAGVQMTPGARSLVVVNRAREATFGAGPRNARFVLQLDVYLLGFHAQFHAIHEPGRGDPQNLLIQLAVLHDEVSETGAGKGSFPAYLLDLSSPASYRGSCPAKRSRAPRGRDPARDTRIWTGECPPPWR